MKSGILNKKWKAIWDIFLMFLFIYNISFVFFPEILRTRVLIGLLGLLIYFRKSKFNIPKELLDLFFLIIIGLIIILLSILINDTLDPRFIGNTFQNILYLFGAYILVEKANYDFIYLIKIIVLSIAFHNALAWAMYLNEGLLQLLWSFQSAGEKFDYAFGNAIEFGTRFLGIGIGSFFSGGIISCVGMILCSYIVSSVKNNKLIWAILLMFLFITGIFIARIAYVGIAISILFLVIIYLKEGNFKHLPAIIFIFLLFLVIVTFFLTIYLDTLLASNSFRHSFEIVINLFSSGELSTKSTEVVQNMLIFPTEFKSFLIGDGKFYNADGSFYMRTDIGYSRLMFYFGIIGTVSYFLVHLYITYKLYYASYSNYKFRVLITAFFILLIIGNFKGLLDLNWLMFLFFWTVVVNRNFKRNEIVPYHK